MTLMLVFKSNHLYRTGFFSLITVIAALCLLLVSSLTVSASTVTINDPQHVLNASQVQSEGQNLSYPLDIYVTSNFSGTRTQFDQRVKQDINSANKIVMAIDTGHKYLAIAGGKSVPLSNSQYQDAVNAFSSNFNNGDYTGATIAAMRSLESALPANSNSNSNNSNSNPNNSVPSSNAAGGFAGNLVGTLCCVGLVILAIFGALFFVLRRRGGFGGFGGPRRNVPPYQQPVAPYNQYNQGYPPGYGPGYPGYNQGGMNPWAAGGMGAAAGGLIGYELGKEQGEDQAREQQVGNNDNPNNDGGGFGGGAGGNFGGNDNGGFGGGAGGGFGGGDWGGGGGNDWGGGGGGGGDAGGGAGGNF